MEKIYNFLVPLVRAFLGIFGVDCFILKDTKRGIKRIVGTVLTYMFIFVFSFSIIKIHYAYIALLILFIRFLYYFITGLKLLKKGKDKVLEYYFNNDKSKEELRRKNKFLDIFFKVLINGKILIHTLVILSIIIVFFFTQYGVSIDLLPKIILFVIIFTLFIIGTLIPLIFNNKSLKDKIAVGSGYVLASYVFIFLYLIILFKR